MFSSCRWHHRSNHHLCFHGKTRFPLFTFNLLKMGKKKYYCDFCNRHFNDDKNTRTKHLNSIGHLNMRKKHYSLFRDTETILKEELAKKPCRKFHQEGYCSFGEICTFSHYSESDLNQLKNELEQKNFLKSTNIPSVESWLLKYHQKLEMKKEKSRKLLWSCELPNEFLMNPGLLPPSLLPFHIQDYVNADLESWGE